MKLNANSLAQIMGYLKGKSSLIIFEKSVSLKYKYGTMHFRHRGYDVDLQSNCDCLIFTGIYSILRSAGNPVTVLRR